MEKLIRRPTSPKKATIIQQMLGSIGQLSCLVFQRFRVKIYARTWF